MVTTAKRNITKNGVDLDAIKLPKLMVLDPFDIEPLANQIRKNFFGITELAASIQTAGQATPIIVRETPRGVHPYGLIDGERRLKACCSIKRGIIACIHDGVMNLDDVHALSVAANFGRQAHDCMEIAKAIVEFKANKKKLKEISAIFGKSTAWVLQHYSLLKLHKRIQEWLVPGAVINHSAASMGSRKISSRLSFSIALQLVPLPRETQLDVAKRIVGQGLSLVEAKRLILKSARTVPGYVDRSTHKPTEWRRTLLSVMTMIKTRVATYNDMPGSQIENLLTGFTKSELQSLYQSLSQTGEEIIQLANGVKWAIEKK